MDVRSCRKCKRLFNYVVGPHICPACREEMEKLFSEVKKYIQENPSSGIMEVSQEFDIDPMQITKWIREERLQFADSVAIGLECERCGANIRSGKYCDRCKLEMTKSFNAAINKPGTAASSQSSSSARMRFLDGK